MHAFQLVDTHCHLYAEEFLEDRAEVVRRAKDAGVYRILLPNIDRGSMDLMLSVERDYSGFCHAMMGLHPCYVKADVEEQLEVVRDWISVRRFIGIGEIGLDFYWDLTFKEQQYRAFRQQLQWAMDKDWPVSIHSRESLRECIDEVKRIGNGRIRGIFHCFGGGVAEAQEIMEMGMFLGIGGVATFKKSGLDAVIPEIGLDRIVLETDAPYLAPVPHRGKRNEPAYLKLVAEKLAEITGKTVEEIAAVTTRNADLVFI